MLNMGCAREVAKYPNPASTFAVEQPSNVAEEVFSDNWNCEVFGPSTFTHGHGDEYLTRIWTHHFRHLRVIHYIL